MPDAPPMPQRSPSWSRTLLRVLMVCGGSVAILLPAWLPNRPSVPISSGTVVLLQSALLAAAAAVMFGAAPHAGHYRPVCRVLGISLIAAFMGEIDDFITEILGWNSHETLMLWLIALVSLAALATAFRHRRAMLHFAATLGNHAGSGLIAAALLIIYIFNHVIGSTKFWKASLGAAFSPSIPRICKGYLELLACYLLFIGALGLSLTLARRKDPS